MGLPGLKLAVGLFTAVLALWLAVMAVLIRQSALPPEVSGTMLAIFEPGSPEDEIFARTILTVKPRIPKDSIAPLCQFSDRAALPDGSNIDRADASIFIGTEDEFKAEMGMK